MLERLNEEIRRRTRVVRIFPNEGSCLRLVRALAVEVHENLIEAHRYLDISGRTYVTAVVASELSWHLFPQGLGVQFQQVCSA